MRRIIAYGLASSRTYERERQDAQRAADRLDGEVILWRRDGEGQLSERHRLHQSLFCLRAGLADVLWVPNLLVLGDAVAQSLVLAHVRDAGAALVVDEVLLDLDAAAVEPLQRLAGATVGRLNAADPRQGSLAGGIGEPDFGQQADDQLNRRLAHKLVHDFELTLSQAAQFLNRAGLRSPTGKLFTPANVDRIQAQDDDVNTSYLSRLHDTARLAGTSMLLTAGRDARDLLPEATAYNNRRPSPSPYVAALESAEAGAADNRGWGTTLPDQTVNSLLFGACSHLINGLYISTGDVFAHRWVRELVYGALWYAGAEVIVGGKSAQYRGSDGDEYLHSMRGVIRSAVGLHTTLRVHDGDTVIADDLSPVAAAKLAEQLRAEGWMLREIAHKLNDRGFATRGKVGRWHPSTVGDLLS